MTHAAHQWRKSHQRCSSTLIKPKWAGQQACWSAQHSLFNRLLIRFASCVTQTSGDSKGQVRRIIRKNIRTSLLIKKRTTRPAGENTDVSLLISEGFALWTGHKGWTKFRMEEFENLVRLYKTQKVELKFSWKWKRNLLNRNKTLYFGKCYSIQ